MAEIHVHGGKAVITSCIKMKFLKINNCRLAEPGEFTKACISKWKN